MRKSYINSNKQVNVSNPLPGCDVDTPDPKRRWLGSSHPGRSHGLSPPILGRQCHPLEWDQVECNMNDAPTELEGPPNVAEPVQYQEDVCECNMKDPLVAIDVGEPDNDAGYFLWSRVGIAVEPELVAGVFHGRSRH